MPEVATADPERLDEVAKRLAAGARALATAGSGLSVAVPGWLGAGAHGEAAAAVVLREWLDSSCDAFGLAAGALRQYAEAVRDGGAGPAAAVRDGDVGSVAAVRDGGAGPAAARAASILRTAAAMAPSPPMVTSSIPPRPTIEMISWGSAFDDVLGAGKAVGHGVESLGGDAVSAGKDLAHLGESAAGEVRDGFESFLGFVDDTNLTLNADAHAMLSTLGDTAEQIWGGLERAAGTRPGELLSIESLSHWRSWFGQVGLAIGNPALRGALREAAELGAGAADVAKVIFSDYGRYREIEKQQQYPPIDGAPKYDQIHRTEKSNQHIIKGRSNGNGGHMARVGQPAKTEFPDGWKETKIYEVVDKAAQNPIGPMSVRTTSNGELQYGYKGEADGLDITVAVDPSGEIISAYPEPDQPGVYRNPRAPKPRPAGTTNWGPHWVRPDRDPQGTGYFVWHQAGGATLETDANGNPR